MTFFVQSIEVLIDLQFSKIEISLRHSLESASVAMIQRNTHNLHIVLQKIDARVEFIEIQLLYILEVPERIRKLLMVPLVAYKILMLLILSFFLM